jgi:integrase/recombinase XerD
MGLYLLDCRADLAPSTVVTKYTVLRAVERYLGRSLVEASERDVRRWWRALPAGVARPTRAAYLSHVRTYCRWLSREDLRPDDPTRRIDAPRRRRGVPRDLDPGRVLAILDGLSGAARDAVDLMLHLGLRCAETAAVRPGTDLRTRADGRTSLRVVGKGGAERVPPVPAHLAARLRAHPGGWLFPSAASSSGHLTPGRIGWVVADALRSGGLPGATAHQLRHTAATALLARTGDITLVKAFLGHASLTSTEIYARSAAVPADIIETLYSPRERVSERSRENTD